MLFTFQAEKLLGLNKHTLVSAHDLVRVKFDIYPTGTENFSGIKSTYPMCYYHTTNAK